MTCALKGACRSDTSRIEFDGPRERRTKKMGKRPRKEKWRIKLVVRYSWEGQRLREGKDADGMGMGPIPWEVTIEEDRDRRTKGWITMVRGGIDDARVKLEGHRLSPLPQMSKTAGMRRQWWK